MPKSTDLKIGDQILWVHTINGRNIIDEANMYYSLGYKPKYLSDIAYTVSKKDVTLTITILTPRAIAAVNNEDGRFFTFTRRQFNSAPNMNKK